MEKDFDSWNRLKKQLDKIESNNYIKEGDIFWCSIGLNIKSESFGKGEKFRRPVLVIKKLSHDTCFGVPLSTKIKSGTWFYNYNLDGEKYTALLYQMRMFHKNRFGFKIGELNDYDFLEIKKRVKKLLNL